MSFWNILPRLIFLGGAFEGVHATDTPFGYKRGEGIDAGHGDPNWIVSKDKYKSDEIFKTLEPIDGKITGRCTFI